MQRVEHLFLVSGKNEEEAIFKVKHFLNRYELVRYDQFEIKDVLNGNSEAFFKRLEIALKKNKQILESFIEELKSEGYEITESFKTLPQGYLSKVFHSLAHFLDGFFGIDSYFYSLIEDSHFLSPLIEKKLKKHSEEYFLVLVEGYIGESLRRFEWLNSKKFLKF